MLGWMKGAQSDHPLADEKAARELIAELPANDSIKTLEELAFWLDSLKTADDLKVGRMVEIVDLIDASAKNHQRKLSQEYLTGRERLQKFQENRIWTTVFRFWKDLALAYERSYLLVPRKLMEGGHDFDMARYRIMQRAA